MFTDMEFTMRQFFLRSKIEELDLEDKDNNQFVMLPSCACSAEEMTKFMQSEFDYELDGLLFYNNSVYFPIIIK
jgi:NADH:ubiquinone oxidoreductase subunit B-like Fe-S oxidoreductase